MDISDHGGDVPEDRIHEMATGTVGVFKGLRGVTGKHPLIHRSLLGGQGPRAAVPGRRSGDSLRMGVGSVRHPLISAVGLTTAVAILCSSFLTLRCRTATPYCSASSAALYWKWRCSAPVGGHRGRCGDPWVGWHRPMPRYHYHLLVVSLNGLPFNIVDAMALDFVTRDGIRKPWSPGIMRCEDIVA